MTTHDAAQATARDAAELTRLRADLATAEAANASLVETCDRYEKERNTARADLATVRRERDALDEYLDAIAAIPEVDAADGGCDDAVRNAIGILKAELAAEVSLREATEETLRIERERPVETAKERDGLKALIAKRCPRHFAPNNECDWQAHYAFRKHGWERTPCELTDAEEAALATSERES